jgi:hypothetical protein
VLKVHIWFHKDGDHLVVERVPWWHDIFEWLIINRFCPCHGISGWLSRFEWPGNQIHKISNALYRFHHRKGKELYRVPVPYGCVASSAIWPDDGVFCWQDDCPVHPNEGEEE